ncbi:CopG family transcriptional regulator [Aquincola sp. S2]|uniref:CopG family transcriptional regulator n=1 Tax=Pseudaquabacterium terrae TaxID=2732868 RepID=A0ABX2EKD2_9BURK|nr:CopG family transcriptional regulator [Aquabacterium terrae]NRF69040.1 CopG family transcriptional regulator [Aquabacterium terrae]
MAQVTLYLDEEVDSLMRRSAEAAGVSNSRWVAELIRRHAHAEWPADVIALAGRFPDFPLAEDVRTASGQDMPRAGF